MDFVGVWGSVCSLDGFASFCVIGLILHWSMSSINSSIKPDMVACTLLSEKTQLIIAKIDLEMKGCAALSPN